MLPVMKILNKTWDLGKRRKEQEGTHIPAPLLVPAVNNWLHLFGLCMHTFVCVCVMNRLKLNCRDHDVQP